jgi:hypothetical protein
MSLNEVSHESTLAADPPVPDGHASGRRPRAERRREPAATVRDCPSDTPPPRALGNLAVGLPLEAAAKIASAGSQRKCMNGKGGTRTLDPGIMRALERFSGL